MRCAARCLVRSHVADALRVLLQIINQVAAAYIGARLDCDGFAAAHSSTSYYDKSSFVGLAVMGHYTTIV